MYDGKRKPLYSLERPQEVSDSLIPFLIEEYGYEIISQNPFGCGGRKKYLVLVRTNEHAKHAFFVRVLEGLIGLYTKDVKLMDTSGPDIVFGTPKGYAALEVETGARKQPESELRSRFRKLKKEYRTVLVLVTDKYQKRKYGKYARTVTRTEIRDAIESLFW